MIYAETIEPDQSAELFLDKEGFECELKQVKKELNRVKMNLNVNCANFSFFI